MSESDMHLGLPRSLRSLVSHKFDLAHASQSLIFSDTHLSVIHSRAGIPFQLRYCPALSRKPTDSKQSSNPSQLPNQDSSAPKKRYDPFEDPSPDLLIARVPDPNNYTHNLVLNKFPVIDNHFILATRANKPQTNVLEEADLALSHKCVQAWHDAGTDTLYAFFNSGALSGASQPHRHLQFLSVEAMQSTASTSGWHLLCSRMTAAAHPHLPLFYDPDLPIAHLATTVSASISSAELFERYLLLLRAASVLVTSSDTSSHRISDVLDESNLMSAKIANESGQTTFSYNLAITESNMAILPRKAEDATIPGLAKKENGTGMVSINGTILAGTLMVKNEDEWEALKTQPTLLDAMLKQIGFPRIDGPKM